mmetsp:Transcript_621/g.1265  ORF Transcript_621/g.1265 Transcript_621/m.1265 type:complete len:388 (-) Transcript_621:154-1317(-)
MDTLHGLLLEDGAVLGARGVRRAERRVRRVGGLLVGQVLNVLGERLDAGDGIHQHRPLGPLVRLPHARARHGRPLAAVDRVKRVPQRRRLLVLVGTGFPSALWHNVSQLLDEHVDAVPPGLLDHGVRLARLVLVPRPSLVLLKLLLRRLLLGWWVPGDGGGVAFGPAEAGDLLAGEEDALEGHGVGGSHGGGRGHACKGLRAGAGVHGRRARVPVVVVAGRVELRVGAADGRAPAEVRELLRRPAEFADGRVLLEHVRAVDEAGGGAKGLGVALVLLPVASERRHGAGVDAGGRGLARERVQDVEEVAPGQPQRARVRPREVHAGGQPPALVRVGPETVQGKGRSLLGHLSVVTALRRRVVARLVANCGRGAKPTGLGARWTRKRSL